MMPTNEAQNCPKCKLPLQEYGNSGKWMCSNFMCEFSWARLPLADWNALCYVNPEDEKPKARMMQGCGVIGCSLFGSARCKHWREHDENSACTVACRYRGTCLPVASPLSHAMQRCMDAVRDEPTPTEPEWEDIPIERNEDGYLCYCGGILHSHAVCEAGFMGYVYADGDIRAGPCRFVTYGMEFPTHWRRRIEKKG